MPTFRVSVYVEVDDQPLTNFPIVRRITTTDSQPLRTTRAAEAFTPLPSGEMTTIAVAIVQANQAVQVAVNGVTTAPIQLNANGLLILVDTALTAVAVQTTATTQLNALVAGT
jgi:hypothetical protein